MSEDSEKEDYSVSDEDESDEDNFMAFVREDIHPCALFTADSISDLFFPRTTQILLEYQLGRWVPRLRGPRDLYGVSSSGPLSPTRWPYHCEVIDEKVQHIDWTPYPEPMYTPTGLEMEPLYPNSKDDIVVYLAEDAYKEPCFVYSRVGGNRTPLKQPVGDCDNTLIFEARFESGNLQKVVKVAEYEYQLTVRPDLFTNKHTQWYYFQVTNTQAGIAYRFTIVNFTKPASLYNRGMRPLFYSEKEAEAHHVGWKRVGDQIKYYRNNLGQDGRHYFSLTWTFQFPHNKDTCYFAHCYPYTYSNLQDYLSGINGDPVRSKFCKIRVLCHTLARNMVYVLTITNPLKITEPRQRKAVILTARVHPGETNSSWIMKGFLDYILGDSSDAQLLRDTFIFKVVPMLNPDGVIVGNYRCSLAGRDLNRSYTSVLKESFPSVWYTRNMIRRLMEKREVLLYCDLHGHSRKENIFMYGCDGSDRAKGLYLQQRIFPLMLSKNCPDKFSFSACKFNVQKSKEGTGRVVMWRMGIRNSFTMEATFCGSTLGNKRGTHFNTKDLESMGYHFCDSLLDYCDPDRAKYFQCLKELEEMEKHISLEKIFDDSDTSLIEITLDLESSSRGSDSSESNDSQTYPLKLTSQLKTKRYLKTKKERNSAITSLKSAREEQEVCVRGHSQQRYNEPNTDLKDTRANVSEEYIDEYFRRQFPHQGLELQHNLKSKLRRFPSFQSKKADVNWTDDEKRIYRDKRLAQTQEMLQYLLPMVDSSKTIQPPHIKQMFSPRANVQAQHQLTLTTTCLNRQRNGSSWTASRNPPFLAQKGLLTDSSGWLQPVPQKSFESLSPLKDPKNKKKHPGACTSKTEYKKHFNSKWEAISSSGQMDANVTKERSLQAKESRSPSLIQAARNLTRNQNKQPHNSQGQATSHLKYGRDN
ncbi:cytosolic carboxypeptidase 3 [Orycteropus afer afer]|uniref:Cytosolic carboxypeptidase 3 n=1 Tax=Orycteropus afer afer TaxID=1230840 RepID=A0A8B7AT05_ORYAF|nr:cytosolic carboxypeptidase 3 [Orycteropus afer afer]